MDDSSVEKTVEDLLAIDGITEVRVDVTLKPVVSKRTTGVVDDYFQEIRERTVSEETLGEKLQGTKWRYHGAIDSMNDFHVRDKITQQYTRSEQ